MKKLALNLLALAIIAAGAGQLNGVATTVALHDTATAQSRVDDVACCTSGDGDRCCSRDGCSADEDSCETN